MNLPTGWEMERGPVFKDLILAKDLDYVNTSLLMSRLEEVNKLPETYIASILAPGF